MPDLAGVLADLDAESVALDDLVAPLPDWSLATPAEGWTIAHQIAHLHWTDNIASVAALDPDRFADVLTEAAADPFGFVDRAAEKLAAGSRIGLLAFWRAGRLGLDLALRQVRDGARIAWFGPPMSPTTMATARLMETWAHGLDVADALGVTRPWSDRVRHVAHIGVRTRDFAYVVRDQSPPAEPFRVELTTPSGEVWTWGPADATQRITAPALDFCLLVTQRRHRDDLAVNAVGADADAWLGIAQAFAGLPGPGRPHS